MELRFVNCSDPIMDADHNCLTATNHLTYMMRETIRDLVEPIRFGQALAARVLREEENSEKVKSLLTCTKAV